MMESRNTWTWTWHIRHSVTSLNLVQDELCRSNPKAVTAQEGGSSTDHAPVEQESF